VNDTAVFGDWGTSRLKLFRVREGRAVAQVEAPGIGVATAPPAEVLVAALAPWRQEQAIDRIWLCGMAGSRGGLIEADYVPCPAGPEQWAARSSTITVDGIRIVVAPGISFRGALERDVMRGEEAQIFGALALDPALGTGEHLIVLPGTHSKWVRIVDGRIVAFQTYPTGELFNLLAERSTLVARDTAALSRGDREEGFAQGLDRAGPAMFASLFTARAAQLLDGRSAEWARGYLSGLLIGSEVAGETMLPGNVVLIGEPALCDRYEAALARFRRGTTRMDGRETVLAGLEGLRRSLP
jgi:2-dehydro-3-deoxygalactonokinase